VVRRKKKPQTTRRRSKNLQTSSPIKNRGVLI